MAGGPGAGERRGRLPIIVAAAALVVAGAGLAHAATGLASEDAFDPDYLWEPWPPLEDNAALIGIVSLVVFACAGAVVAVAVRQGRTAPSFLAQVLVMVALGIWLGAGYRIVTDGVSGANIGGGLVLLMTPIVVLAALALVVAIGIHRRRRPA